jgi:hypothetical protein
VSTICSRRPFVHLARELPAEFHFLVVAILCNLLEFDGDCFTFSVVVDESNSDLVPGSNQTNPAFAQQWLFKIYY